MDIKDFILIGGGLLIAAVVAHGFWIAWRDRRQDLRIDIKPDLIPGDMDEMARLRAELPNGGGRVVRPLVDDPQQDLLDLVEPPPLLLEPTEAPPASRVQVEPTVDQRDVQEAASEPLPDAMDESLAPADLEAGSEPTPAWAAEASTDGAPAAERPTERARVADVSLPEPIVTEAPRRPRRLAQHKSAEVPSTAAPGSAAGVPAASASAKPREAAAARPVEELVVMNVLAEPQKPYTGDELFTTLRSSGLKFGDMNIFHRVEPLTKVVQYSVASAVEPGTFDMADMEGIRCPGLCLFMQLPGPEDPSAAFEDMLSVAKSVARSLGGEVRDEHRNVMTPQTVEHYRQRIMDFSRRRMSKRA